MDAKSAARERLESARDGLLDLSHRIHAHPELGFEEEMSSAWLCESLADAGFAVEKGICDLPTAFRARFGSGPLNVGICAEYDCLPGIGHACGHNIIAASALGAALAAARVADEVGLTVSVIGTPAEEVGNASGKILLLERGAFRGIHAAMMVHPAPFDMLRAKIIAASMFEVLYDMLIDYEGTFRSASGHYRFGRWRICPRVFRRRGTQSRRSGQRRVPSRF